MLCSHAYRHLSKAIVIIDRCDNTAHESSVEQEQKKNIYYYESNSVSERTYEQTDEQFRYRLSDVYSYAFIMVFGAYATTHASIYHKCTIEQKTGIGLPGYACVFECTTRFDAVGAKSPTLYLKSISFLLSYSSPSVNANICILVGLLL